jgi:hypothetical protein
MRYISNDLDITFRIKYILYIYSISPIVSFSKDLVLNWNEQWLCYGSVLTQTRACLLEKNFVV